MDVTFKGQIIDLKVGDRLLIDTGSGYINERVVVEISPSGRLVKFQAWGWYEAADLIFLERIGRRNDV